ncbi:MAG: hypothetical protein JWO72_5 [Caulobacteraceae bacterium]|jgi:hypothetical protein|nr:hypothetical protein [Caulobacteraceae bacterium]
MTSRSDPRHRPTLLQMSAGARLLLALAACAVVWAVIGLALV